MRLKQLEVQLNKPAEIPGEEFQKLSREHSRIKPVVQTFRRYKDTSSELEESRELAQSESGEMAELAVEEVDQLEAELARLKEKLKEQIIPDDPDADRNLVLEIRAGTGGEEAALFVADLFRMYKRYAGNQGWETEIVDLSEADHGGYKELTAMINGSGAFGQLQFESGIHRVQRVPETESGGRIHTSAATVAVLPEAREIDVNIDRQDLEIDTFRASGAGGQHVNMTDSAVRITHEPSGIVVECQDERSQHKNRARAMKILRSRLYEQARQKQQKERRESRRDQVGSGDRSEKIRTYNFPQSRVTDHRIELDLYNLEDILDGDLDELIDALQKSDKLRKLEEIEEETDISRLVQ